MATYTGSIYTNTFLSSLTTVTADFSYITSGNIFQVFSGNQIADDCSTVDNINYFGGNQIVDECKSVVENDNIGFFFTGSTQQNDYLRTIYTNTNIISSSVVYYQRVYSSGLNDWSYYKTVGSIEPNPSPNITTPQYSGTILYHEVIGKLQS